jgi:N-acetylglutamate synthase-like GNAT family acetyltransferase
MPHIRRAASADQPAITALVRRSGLNPINVRWQNFVVADDAGRVVGVAQLRPRADGSRELASLAVQPDQRGKGVGSEMVQVLLLGQPAPIYLFCESELDAFYRRFGFEQIERNTLPAPLKRLFTAGTIVTGIGRLLHKSNSRLIAMRWNG